MSGKKEVTEPAIRLGAELRETFETLQKQIRERAYNIFLDREPDEGREMEDWLRAQEELVRPIELVIKDQKKNVVAECNLKGFSPEEIEIEVEDGVLKILGQHQEKETTKTEEGGESSSSESVYFFQSTTLPAEVDLDKSHAKLFKNGKLKVTLPKLA